MKKASEKIRSRLHFLRCDSLATCDSVDVVATFGRVGADRSTAVAVGERAGVGIVTVLALSVRRIAISLNVESIVERRGCKRPLYTPDQ